MRAVLQGKTFLNKPLTQDSVCVLPISVSWDYHEKEYFQATLRCVAQSFKSCRIVVCDLLQRHSMIFFHPDKSIEEIDAYAIQLGDEWLARHQAHFDLYLSSYTVERWTYWTTHPHYLTKKQIIEEQLRTDRLFKDAFIKTAEEIYFKFMEHKRFGSIAVSKDRFIDKSCDYLVEEAAVVLLWESLHEDVLLYPKKLGKAMEHAMNLFLTKERTFLTPLQLKFKNKTRDLFQNETS